MSGHALLSPSGAARWLACPPSARLEEHYESTSSEAADEGTLAHKLGETLLYFMSGKMRADEYSDQLKEIQNHTLYDAAMLEHCDNYAHFVMERLSAAQVKTPDARLYLEETLDLTDFVPESFGTVDTSILADHLLEILDFKYGKGVAVYAEKNKQMMLYALGALRAFGLLYDIKMVRMTIYQPRLDNITTWEISVADLLSWAKNELMPIAQLAWVGEGEFKAGSHCRFCKVRGTCRANADYRMEIAKLDFKDPVLLTNAEIADILDRADGITKWIAAVEAHALSEAVNNGQQFPGYKIVEGRSNRKFTDEAKIAGTLMLNGFSEAQIYKPKVMIGVTDMEKLTGKTLFKEIINPYVVKPQGMPTLVPATDRRPEFNSLANAINDFKGIED